MSELCVGVVRYLAPVMGEGMLNQTLNPEVRVDLHHSNVVIERTIIQLRQAIIKLRNAFNGHPLWFLSSSGMIIIAQ